MGWKNISHYWRRLVGEQSSTELAHDYQQQRSPAALQQLFVRYADALYYFLRQQSDAQLAEDISQQTWLHFMQIDHPMPPYHSFKAWLFTVARHALIDEFRRQGRWQYTELSASSEYDVQHNHVLSQEHVHSQDQWRYLDEAADPVFILQHAEAMALLDNAIATLPLAQKEALWLQLEGFSLQDIATITQSSAETVKSRLRYAKATLTRQLGTAATFDTAASTTPGAEATLSAQASTELIEPTPSPVQPDASTLAVTAAQDGTAQSSTEPPSYPCRLSPRLGDI